MRECICLNFNGVQAAHRRMTGICAMWDLDIAQITCFGAILRDKKNTHIHGWPEFVIRTVVKI